jgi:hypothetical protein
MRVLKLNNTIVDIDTETAIGIDIGTFDFKEPENRKLNVSNSFSIPRTKKNIALLGFSDTLQSLSNVCYEKISVEYSINGILYIKNGKANITKITGERIELSAASEVDFWDNLKNVTFVDMIGHCMDGIILPDPNTSTLIISPIGVTNYINTLKNDFGIELLYYFGIDGVKSLDWLLIPITQYCVSESISEVIHNYSKFCIPLPKVIECINKYYFDTFGIEPINTSSTLFDSNFDSIYIPIWQFIPVIRLGGFVNFLDSRNVSGVIFGNDKENVKAFDKVTTFDFVKSLLQAFGASFNIKDGVYSFYRLSDINQSDLIDWSGKLQSMEYAPIIPNMERNNYINYKATFDGGNVRDTACNIKCLNENLDNEKDLISISSTYTPRITSQNNNSPFLSNEFFIPFYDKEEQFNSFSFLVKKPDIIFGISSIFQKIRIFDMISDVNYDIPISQAYGLVDEYTFHKQICEKPRVFNAKIWLNSFDLYDFDQSKLRYIKELGGTFFVNKIKGFNPTLPSQSVDVELIFVNYNIPFNIETVTNYVDGVQAPYVDGVGNYYV